MGLSPSCSSSPASTPQSWGCRDMRDASKDVIPSYYKGADLGAGRAELRWSSELPTEKATEVQALDATWPESHSKLEAEEVLPPRAPRQPTPPSTYRGWGSRTSLSNPRSPGAASQGKQGGWVPQSRGEVLDHFRRAAKTRLLRSLAPGAECCPASERAPVCRGPTATPGGGRGAVPGDWGLARAANGTQLDPPAEREAGGRAGRGLRRWQRRPAGCTVPLPAWPRARARPARFPAR